MGQPRLIIVIRHAQSQGNMNRLIHQELADHRVPLTPLGWTQAHDAGRRLRGLLRHDDTIQLYTSPYRRTRETTEGLLRALTSSEPEESPFKRDAIKVYEEPRLREQEWGNLQPDKHTMEKMWKDRAEYGHFFYRIPNGESAADAYDRVSGFNESLWRSFGDPYFPSVCILVTHGLLTRAFLMKWYHWSVEYFEDLRNVNHCEFVIMERSLDTGKYILQNELRTWSGLRKAKAATEVTENAREDNAHKGGEGSAKRERTCPDECGHQHDEQARAPKRRNTGSPDDSTSEALHRATPPEKVQNTEESQARPDAHSTIPSSTHRDATATPALGTQQPQDGQVKLSSKQDHSELSSKPSALAVRDSLFTTDGALGKIDTHASETSNLHHTATAFSRHLATAHRPRQTPSYLEAGRDFGGSFSGAASPAIPSTPTHSRRTSTDYFGTTLRDAMLKEEVRRVDNEAEAEVHAEESRVGSGAMADALGDQSPEDRREILPSRR